MGDPVLLDQFQKFLGVERFMITKCAKRDRHHVKAQGSGRDRAAQAIGKCWSEFIPHMSAQRIFQKRIRQIDRVLFVLALDSLRGGRSCPTK